ncbi:MAG: GNAT family N-acetyltransferase/peptidase C39 family protein [Chromatiaceae bacterium]|nr:GNAT family N-acetyltransferase/peptidase C39 family protein [Chromatiaceae bacterium]MCP5315479.1 GNAT family N-acetyltransferase/peptidase C39 family protein [Chromatiaceae bacterium]
MDTSPIHSPVTPAVVQIRTAILDDLEGLVALENRCFTDDRISRRQFRHLLTKGHTATLVAEHAGEIVGSLVVLFSRGTATARLYSIAVAPEMRGHGVARQLVEQAEAEAWREERAWMRLEIRKDNAASIGLFESMGYRRFGSHADYYADHMDAWRYEKALDSRLKPVLDRVVWYEQTLDFTCGPACLIMAMKSLDPQVEANRSLELKLWRDATTIFMTSGLGGCGPYGLALAADRRGFNAEVWVNDPGVQMIDSVRNAEKKEVMALVQADMEQEIHERGIPVHLDVLDLTALEAAFDAGAVPLVLISSWQIYNEKSPHWVVVSGFDEHFVYVNDPLVDYDEGETAVDSINMPIGRSQFAQMSRYGRKGLQAVVLITARTER